KRWAGDGRMASSGFSNTAFTSTASKLHKQATAPRPPVTSHSPSLLAQVREIVFHVPSLSTICGSLAKLPHFVRSPIEELQVATQLASVRLGNIVGPVVHDAIFEAAVEVNHAADVVHPELLPPFEAGVVHVVALACVRSSQTGPVLPDHAAS